MIFNSLSIGIIDINGIIRQVSLPTPTGDSAAILLVEHQIICNMLVKEVPLGLMAAFYVLIWNIQKVYERLLWH